MKNQLLNCSGILFLFILSSCNKTYPEKSIFDQIESDIKTKYLATEITRDQLTKNFDGDYSHEIKEFERTDSNIYFSFGPTGESSVSGDFHINLDRIITGDLDKDSIPEKIITCTHSVGAGSIAYQYLIYKGMPDNKFKYIGIYDAGMSRYPFTTLHYIDNLKVVGEYNFINVLNKPKTVTRKFILVNNNLKWKE